MMRGIGLSQLTRRLLSSGGRMAEARAAADGLLSGEQWGAAEAPLEALRSALSTNEPGWRRATAELALARQATGRTEEGAELYEAAVNSEGADNTSDSWDGLAVALLNFAELRGGQERYPEAEALARRALSLLADEELSTRGAALTNLGTYVALQSRGEEAAEAFVSGHTLLARALGPGAEASVGAAANGVRALRALGRDKEAEALLASSGCGAADELSALPEELEAELEALWSQGTSAKQSLDPPGFVRRAVGDKDAQAFMDQWTQLGLPTDETAMQRIMDGMERDGDENAPIDVTAEKQ